jgi:phage tail sheath gpL-like
MSFAPISILGVDNNSLPGVYVQTLFAQGQSSIGNTPYPVLLLGNPISTGTVTSAQDGYQVFGPDTVVGMLSAQDAITLFGAGSPLALMVSDFLRVNPSTPLYAMPIAQASGGTAASVTFTVAGPASANGTIRLAVGADAPVDTAVSNGDTATIIATNIVLNCNSNVNLPVTATSTAGALTLTAKAVGARGNWLTAGIKVLNGATGVTLNSLLYVKQANLTGGAGSDNLGYTTAINSLISQGVRYYYVVPEAGADSVDSTQFVNLQQNFIDPLSQPVIGLRQVMIGGSVDTLTNTETVTSGASSPPTGGVNDPRVSVSWLNGSDVPPSRIAARVAAAVSLFQTPPLSSQGINFDSFGLDSVSQPFWNIPAPLNGAAPSVAVMKAAIMNGITPIRVLRGGNTCIVKLVTTRCNNGVSYDFRIQDEGKVQIIDFFGDDLQVLLSQTYPRKLVAADPPQGAPPPGPNVVTPSMVQDTVIELLQQYGTAGLIDAPSTISGLVVQLNPSPGRIDIMIPMFTGQPLHIFGVALNQVA